jgi:hypothetical protein
MAWWTTDHDQQARAVGLLLPKFVDPLLNQVSGPNTNAVAMDVQNGSQSCVEAELRVLNLTKPMTAKQLELFCNDVCERLNFTLTKSDRREEVVSWVEHWQALWL